MESKATDGKLKVGSVFTIQVILFAIAISGINYFELELGEAQSPRWLMGLAGLLLGALTYGLSLVVRRWLFADSASVLNLLQKLRATVSHFNFGSILAVSAFAAVGEEMLFRALIQNGLSQLVPGWAAIVIASALFAATHALSLFYVVSAFVLSLFLGTGFAVTGSIALVVFWHFAYNVLSFLVLVRYPNLLLLDSGDEPRRHDEESVDAQGTDE